MIKQNTSTLVVKFGGAAVARPESFGAIADIILKRKLHYSRICVVVSAMGDTTDDLIALAHRVNPSPPRRELDMLVSVGERVSIALLAMALSAKGQEAMSFTGSQTGIITSTDHTDARIVDVRPQRILPHLQAGKVIIVAGFQGMSTAGEITTLGRGGSDTTAVALGAALSAEKIEFFKDVAGIYDKDPKRYPEATLFQVLTYEKAHAIVRQGAQVLHDRCILLAERNLIPLHVLPFQSHETGQGTWIGPQQRPEVDTAPQYES